MASRRPDAGRKEVVMNWISEASPYLNQINIDAREKNGSLTPIAAVYGRVDAPETIATARLICSAPNLLKVCKETRNLLDDSLLKWKTDYYLPIASIDSFEKHLDEIITVIEKVEGSES